MMLVLERYAPGILWVGALIHCALCIRLPDHQSKTEMMFPNGSFMAVHMWRAGAQTHLTVNCVTAVAMTKCHHCNGLWMRRKNAGSPASLYARKSLESLHLTWWLFKYGNPSNCDIRNSTTNTALMWQRKRERQELMEIEEQGVKCNSKPDNIQIVKTNTDRYFCYLH